MKIKKFFTAFILIVFCISIYTNTFAYTFNQRFSEVYGINSIIDARSPARTSSGSDDFVGVLSKCNQPRKIGTSPHIGTDIDMTQGRNVYSIFGGTVSAVNTDTSAQVGSITVNLDINGDGTADGYYIRYIHVIPNSTMTVGKKVTSTTIIATIDSQKPNGYVPHLHFARENSTASISYKLYNFYRHTSISTWNNGESMDFFAGDSKVGNKIYITAYTMDDRAWEDLSGVQVFYKVGSGSWSSTPKSMTKISSYARWEFDFSTVASSGQTVSYYLAGIRADITGDNWGLWPQYYSAPPKLPSGFGSNPIQYGSITIQ